MKAIKITPGGQIGGLVKNSFAKIRDVAEFLSFIALILGIPFGLMDLHNHAVEAADNARKERVEAAEKVYQMVDEHFGKFVELCLAHPRLDCYSVARERVHLTEDEKIQQKMIYAELTDVFEVAFTQYHKEDTNPEIRKIYDTQWKGWDAYIRKFIKRPAYVGTWYEIGDEYDGQFAEYMNSIAPPRTKVASNRTTNVPAGMAP